MRFLFLAIIVAAGAITFGTAIAATFDEPVTINNGKLTVNDGGLLFQRTDNSQTVLQLKNSDKQVTFQFEDPDDNQIYILRNTNGAGGFFQFVDFSGPTPTARTDISVQRSSGNVAIGHTIATEKLDVDGNIKLSGNILSNGDICIGACP